jgi:nitrous oxidase accessory protein NosD
MTLVIGLPLSACCAYAETVNCTPITSVPYVISSSGVYCLVSDIVTAMTSGNAIEIQSNSVTIDLNGHKLGGAAAGLATQAIGIYALNRSNTTIMNGTIRGFQRGVYLQDASNNWSNSSGSVVKDLRVDLSTNAGIIVEGRGNVIKDNFITNTGGSTVSLHAFSVLSKGAGARVINNDIVGTATTVLYNDAKGISVYWGKGAIIENNRVTNTTSPTGTAYGIHVEESGASSVIANHVSNDEIAQYAVGIFVGGANSNVRDNTISNVQYGLYTNGAKYMGNMVSGATTAYTGGTAGTGNM